MMHMHVWKERFAQLMCRFRYPVSLPEEVAMALGISLSNRLSFQEFTTLLSSSQCRPTRLARMMPRALAEAAFQAAVSKEYFKESSLFSYYFNKGWVEFALYFDQQSRLRRVYMIHQGVEQERGIELPLPLSPSVV